LRTLEEIKTVLNKLNAQSGFREALAREPAEVQQALGQARKALNRASDAFLRDLRNKVGGHLDESLMQQALDEMDSCREGLLQLGDIRGKIHYQFAGDILWVALLEAPPAEEEARLNDVLKRSAELTPVVSAIDDVVACYARSRGLA